MVLKVYSLDFALLCFVCTISDEVDSNFELDFWRQDVNDYVWADSSSSVSQFTASMWIKISGIYPFTLFSFGTVPIKIQFYMQSDQEADLCFWVDSHRLLRYVSFPYYVDRLSEDLLLPGGGRPKVFGAALPHAP